MDPSAAQQPEGRQCFLEKPHYDASVANLVLKKGVAMFWAAATIAVAVLLAAWTVERQLKHIAQELAALRRLRAKRLKRLIEFYNLRGDLSRPNPELLVELMDKDPAFFLRGPKATPQQPPSNQP